MDYPYRVDWAKNTRELFVELADRAARKGVRKEFLEAAKTVFHRLHTDPLIFGDPRFHLPDMDVEVRTGMVSLLFVEYGVNEKEKLVWVRDLVLMVE